MNAYIICWVTWAAIIALMAYWRRSWFGLMVFPLVLSGIIGGLAWWRPQYALWFSIAVHGLLVAVICFTAIFREKSGDEALLNRGKKRPDSKL
ncbi:MAG: hypothetical protein KDK99_14435 [Verrucomicrobiales bacterium]|nr:hypothetical protein [Verrucomicrobiales bacterium]